MPTTQNTEQSKPRIIKNTKPEKDPKTQNPRQSATVLTSFLKYQSVLMLTHLCASILFTILFHLFGSHGCVLKAETQGLDRSLFT